MVKSASTYVLPFDETLNKELQGKQMDVHFRFWDRDTVVTQYFESMFLGHGTAEHLSTTLGPLVTSLGHRRLLQLPMDGPNVNLKLQRLMEEDIARNTPAKMIDIGTCGLHTLRNVQPLPGFTGKERGLQRSCRGNNSTTEILQTQVRHLWYLFMEICFFVFLLRLLT